MVHLQSLSILSDLPLNAYVSATKVAARTKQAGTKQGGFMKKNLTSAMATVILIAAAMATPVFAQHSGPMKVTVPFNFVVENDHLKAGDYTIERIANGRLRIRSNDGNASTTFLAVATQRTAAPEKAHFIFNHYGTEYFLAKIWTPGQETGWEVLQGKLEMELAKRKTVRVETASVIGH
jgi:hypothetical protein